MATKNLARTVMELGRKKELRFDQRQSRRTERRKVRVELATIASDPAIADGALFTQRVPFPVTPNDQGCNSQTLDRWLMAHVGRPWSEVYAEISAKFDRRTTRGRHIVEEHILHSVRPWNHHYANIAHFLIGEDGILRPRHRTPESADSKQRSRDNAEILNLRGLGRDNEIYAWLVGRTIGVRGSHYFWFVSANENYWSYRQDRKFTEDDLAFWKSLSLFRRKDLEKR